MRPGPGRSRTGLWQPEARCRSPENLNIVAAGGGLLVDDEEFTPEWVTTTLLPVLRDPAQLLDMAAAARSFGTLDAAGRLADLVLDAAREAP